MQVFGFLPLYIIYQWVMVLFVGVGVGVVFNGGGRYSVGVSCVDGCGESQIE